MYREVFPCSLVLILVSFWFSMKFFWNFLFGVFLFLFSLFILGCLLVEDTSSLSLEGSLSRVNEALVAQNFPWLFSLVRSSAAHLQFLLVLEVVLQTRLWRLWAQGNAFSAFLGSWF